MDWDGSNLRNFVSVADHSSIGFLYDFSNQYPSNSAGVILGDNHHHHHHHHHQHEIQGGMLADYGNNQGHHLHLHNDKDQKKKKLRSDQLELLERSFQEEIKLDPDRKLKLSRELGLQPRQIAVWFQNRRARWKAKQLERLYDTLKLEFDVISREKLKLQEEVLRLKAMVGDTEAVTKKQVSAGQTEISGEETVESARRSSEVIRCSAAGVMNAKGAPHHPTPESGYQLSSVHENYNAVMNSYWGGFPSYP